MRQTVSARQVALVCNSTRQTRVRDYRRDFLRITGRAFRIKLALVNLPGPQNADLRLLSGGALISA